MSGNARYIGRVGGLAFAQKIGAAVFTGTAVAWADSSDTTGGSATSASSSPQHSRIHAGPARSAAKVKSASTSVSDSSDTDLDDQAATASSDDDQPAPGAKEKAESTTPATGLVTKSADRKRVSKTDRAEARALARSAAVAPAPAAEPSPFLALRAFSIYYLAQQRGILNGLENKQGVLELVIFQLQKAKFII